MSQLNEQASTQLMTSLSNEQIDALTHAIERCYLVDITKTMPTMEDRAATLNLQKHFPYVEKDCGLHYSIYTATKQIEHETKLQLIRTFAIQYKVSDFVTKLVQFTNYDINYENVYYEWIKLESLLKIVCGILNQSMPDPDYYNSTQEILQSYIDLWWYLDKNVIPQPR
jgi:hypothetical protein